MTKAKLPSSVRVGYKTFEIIVWEPAVAKAEHKYGECDHVGMVIRIDTTHGEVQTAETLIHEILHAIFDVMGAANVDGWSEEYLVSFQASGLTQVLVDNPDIGAFITQATRHNNPNLA